MTHPETESGSPTRPPTDRSTSRVVGGNLARLRESVTARELAAKLTELGVPLSPSGITDIEAGRRTVSVDQLTALSAALDVSPLALLLPATPDGGTPTRLTGIEASAQLMLGWLRAEAPADEYEVTQYFESEAFRRRSLPEWAWPKAGFDDGG